MHRRFLAIALGALVATSTAGALALASGTAHPTLTLASRNPIKVVGRHFTPGRRVKVTVSASGTRSRRASTNAQGTFTVTFASGLDRCSAWSVTASQPGRAPIILHGPKPMCAPAGTP